MVSVTEVGRNPRPMKRVSIEEALLLLMWLANRQAMIEMITSKQIALNVVGFAAYYPNAKSLILSGDGSAFERMIWAARDCMVFDRPMAASMMEHHMKRQPVEEHFNLMGRPLPELALAVPFRFARHPGTLGLAVQLGIESFGGLYKIQSYSLPDQEALLEMMVRDRDPIGIARTMGVPT